MKKSTILVSLSVSLFGLGLWACSEEETPAPLPAPAAPAAEAKTADAASANAEPELKPIEPAEAASIAPPTKPGLIGTSGRYVIQVGIQPSERGANKIASKLSENGISSYLAQVENPGELEGTYYRVRIGYFATVDAARDYAKATLEPLGYAWWVDVRSNDDVGNPSATSSNSSTQEAYSEPAPAPQQSSAGWNEPAAAAPTPAPAAPAPAAPAPAPSAPAASANDGWDSPAPAAQPSTPPKAAATQAVEDDGWN